MSSDLIYIAIAALIVATLIPAIMRYTMVESKDLSNECYREYQWPSRGDVPYKIIHPQQLFVDDTTHRVLDAFNTVHCVPAPGHHGCVLRWIPKKGCPPVP